MIDFHDKLATQQQDQARQGLGDHLVPFPESEVPPDVDKPRQLQAPVTVKKVNKGRVEICFLNCTKIDSFWKLPEQGEKKRLSFRAASQ